MVSNNSRDQTSGESMKSCLGRKRQFTSNEFQFRSKETQQSKNLNSFYEIILRLQNICKDLI